MREREREREREKGELLHYQILIDAFTIELFRSGALRSRVYIITHITHLAVFTSWYYIHIHFIHTITLVYYKVIRKFSVSYWVIVRMKVYDMIWYTPSWYIEICEVIKEERKQVLLLGRYLPYNIYDIIYLYFEGKRSKWVPFAIKRGRL